MNDDRIERERAARYYSIALRTYVFVFNSFVWSFFLVFLFQSDFFQKEHTKRINRGEIRRKILYLFHRL